MKFGHVATLMLLTYRREHKNKIWLTKKEIPREKLRSHSATLSRQNVTKEKLQLDCIRHTRLLSPYKKLCNILFLSKRMIVNGWIHFQAYNILLIIHRNYVALERYGSWQLWVMLQRVNPAITLSTFSLRRSYWSLLVHISSSLYEQSAGT